MAPLAGYLLLLLLHFHLRGARSRCFRGPPLFEPSVRGSRAHDGSNSARVDPDVPAHVRPEAKLFDVARDRFLHLTARWSAGGAGPSGVTLESDGVVPSELYCVRM